jgi:hypothetical protein
MNRKLLSTALLIIALGGMAAGNSKSTTSVSSYPRSFKEEAKVLPPAKKSRVRLYPNPTSDGNLSISSTTASDNIHFYVFDLEGTMVRQLLLKEKQKHRIKNLKKGIYVYDVFVNDTSIEQGKIIVK